VPLLPLGSFVSANVPIGGSGAVPPVKLTNRSMRSSVPRPPNSNRCKLQALPVSACLLYATLSSSFATELSA
jgi:hypothetical protein